MQFQVPAMPEVKFPQYTDYKVDYVRNGISDAQKQIERFMSKNESFCDDNMLLNALDALEMGKVDTDALCKDINEWRGIVQDYEDHIKNLNKFIQTIISDAKDTQAFLQNRILTLTHQIAELQAKLAENSSN
jgi:RNA processing factor Prp31